MYCRSPIGNGSTPACLRLDGRTMPRRIVTEVTEYSRSLGTAVQYRSIFEAARPTNGANAGGPRLIANGGVGLVKALHLDHSKSFLLEQRPCTEL
jgi:hypothetical protein